MAKLQVHAATHEAPFQHGASPGRAGDCDQNRLRAILRMPRNQRGAAALKHRRVAVILRSNLQHGLRRQVAEENPAFNLRLDNMVIYLVTEVGMRREQ